MLMLYIQFLYIWPNALKDVGMIRMDGGQWTTASRASYNLRDTVARCTTQVCRYR